jgi:4-amino-4-deoxy-L-arabinose transferase-like glycosyltransferase
LKSFQKLMIDSSNILPFLGVFVLALLLDYWLTFGLRNRQKQRNGEAALSIADQIKQIWRHAKALKSRLLKLWLFLKQSRRLKVYSLFGGTALITAGLFLFVAKKDPGSGWEPWLLFIVGIFLFVWKLPFESASAVSSEVDSPAVNFDRPTRGWQSICLLASPFLAILAALQAGDSAMMINPTLSVAAWIISISLAVLGAWDFSTQQFRLYLGKVVLPFGLLVAVAFIIRGVNVTHVPPVLTGDEGSVGLSALRFIHGETNNIFAIGWFSFPALFFYLQSLSISLLGQTIAALRLPSALIGGLTVGSVFLLARKLFGSRTAWFSAIFLSAYHFHIHFSRLGLNNVWDGLWFTAVLGAVWVGWQEERRNTWLLAGLALGFAQYFYVTSRLLIFVPLAFLAVVALRDRQRLFRLLPQIMSMFLVAMVVCLPLAIFYLKHPDDFMAPFNRVSVMGSWLQVTVASTGLSPWQIFAQQLSLSFQALFKIPLRTWYDANVPLLRPFSGALFVFGITTLIARNRDSRLALLGIWILTFILTGAMSESVPASQRYLAIAPALSICVGFGLSILLQRLADLWPGLLRFTFAAGLLVICLIGLDELNFYFFKYTPNSDLGGFNTRVAQQLADYLENKNGDWNVLLYGSPSLGYRSISSLPYRLPGVVGMDMVAPWGSSENPSPQSGHLLFVFLPNHQQDLQQVEASLPGGKLVEEYGLNHELLFWSYELSR